MKKLMKYVTVILGLGLIGLTTTANAQNTKLRAPGESVMSLILKACLGTGKTNY